MPGRTVAFDELFESQACFLWGTPESADDAMREFVGMLASSERLPSRGEIFFERADSWIQVLYRVSSRGEFVTLVGVAVAMKAA